MVSAGGVASGRESGIVPQETEEGPGSRREAMDQDQGGDQGRWAEIRCNGEAEGEMQSSQAVNSAG